MDEARTQKLNQLEELKNSLEGIVTDIYSNVEISTLDKSIIIKIMEYVGNRYGSIENDFDNDFYGFYDVGYKLFREQLERESKLDNEERKMFFDGTMGWLFYNPGSMHEKERNKALLQYVEKYGIDRLNRNFEQIFERYNSLIKISEQSADAIAEKYQKKSTDIAYYTMFIQNRSALIVRMMKIKEIIPDFSPKFEK